MIGQLAHLGLAKETAFGTPVAADTYLPFNSESIVHNIEQLLSEEQRGIRDESPSYKGLETVAGDLNFDVRPDTIGHIMRSAFGAPSVTGVGPYVHVFSPIQSAFAADCFNPPYTFEIFKDLGQAFQVAGGVVNSLAFEFGVGQKILRATAGVIAKDVALITKTTPSFGTLSPFLWAEAAISIGGSANTNLEAVSITLNNSLEGYPTLNNTTKIGKIRPNGVRTVDCSFTFDVNDLAEYNRFKDQTETAFDITFTSGTNILKFELPKVRYTAFPVSVSGAGRITVAVTGKAKYDASTAAALKATLTNSIASYNPA